VSDRKSRKLLNRLQAGQILLLENLRLHAEEEKNDPDFAKQLASLCDVYCQRRVRYRHTGHTPRLKASRHHVDTCVAGLLMEKELEFLGKALNNPERPFVAILGGAKGLG
jgi:phosphoglycerate kinase